MAPLMYWPRPGAEYSSSRHALPPAHVHAPQGHAGHAASQVRAHSMAAPSPTWVCQPLSSPMWRTCGWSRCSPRRPTRGACPWWRWTRPRPGCPCRAARRATGSPLSTRVREPCQVLTAAHIIMVCLFLPAAAPPQAAHLGNVLGVGAQLVGVGVELLHRGEAPRLHLDGAAPAGGLGPLLRAQHTTIDGDLRIPCACGPAPCFRGEVAHNATRATQLNSPARRCWSAC